MTGRWVYRDAEQHRCALPSYNITVKPGDIWECGQCGKQWKVDKIDGDQRSGETWIVWKPVDRLGPRDL